jgi:hypothetical protein
VENTKLTKRRLEISKHTQGTLKFFRDQGYIAEVVERWLPIPGHPGGGKRRDFLNLIDIIAFNDVETIGVQSCGQDFAAHKRKIEAEDSRHDWLRCKAPSILPVSNSIMIMVFSLQRRLILIGWRKLLKKRGGKLKIWKPRIEEF